MFCSCDAPVPEQENRTKYYPFLTLYNLWLHLGKEKGLGYISKDTLCEEFTCVNFFYRVDFSYLIWLVAEKSP
jgi:hypothetical protein